MNRFPRPATRPARPAGGSGQIFIVVAAIGAVLALGAAATNEYVRAAKREAAGGTYHAADDEIYTGSILYQPDAGNVCHQWLFDNQNGRFFDNGSVDCDRAAYQGLDGPRQWSEARIKVISDGFRDH
ncbi:MAG TPA: hypothetical protein VMC05_09385 [Xanthobacteraceae bacterium]|nr:hypothetical protein [Xanthobacteraceae bacterium]